MKHFRTTALFAALIVGMPLLPLLAQTTAGPATATPQMPMMQMMAAMENCQKNCQTAVANVDEMIKAMADAKKVNDGALPPATVNQMEATLARMKTTMTECKGTMAHMAEHK